MAIVPDVEFFLKPIVEETHLDIFQRRLKMAERLINFPTEKMSKLHLEEWYCSYWKLLDMVQYVNEPSEQRDAVANQIFSTAVNVPDIVKRQYFALALLLFGKPRESQMLMNQALWSEDLRADFAKYAAWSQLANGGNNLQDRATIKRNQVINNLLREKYSALIEKYATAKVDENTCPKVAPNDYKIFYCWLQGEDNLPPILRCCYNSIKMNAGNREVIFIDEKNFSNYVDIPEYILKRFWTGGGYHTYPLFRNFAGKSSGTLRRSVVRFDDFAYRAA